MTLHLQVPTISITPENEEDDDNNYFSFAEALTDVEELYIGTERSNKSKIRNKKRGKSKLLVKVPADNAIYTDVENMEGSDAEEEKIVLHAKPIVLENLDLDSGNYEETFNIQAKNCKGKHKLQAQMSTTKLKPTSKHLNNVLDIALTDIEDLEASDIEENFEIPDIDIPKELLPIIDDVNIRDNVFNLDRNAPFVSTHDGIDLHTESFEALLNIPHLVEPNLTDVEVVSDSNSIRIPKKNKKIRRRRPRGTLRNKGSVTDIEDIDLTAEEVKKYNIFKPPDLSKLSANNKLKNISSQLYDSDYEENEEPIIRKRIVKQQNLYISENDCGLTDLDDINFTDVEDYDYDNSEINKQLETLADYYSSVSEKTSDKPKTTLTYEEDTDVDAYETDNEIDFSSDEQNHFKVSFMNIDTNNYLAPDINTLKGGTDLESLYSSDEEREIIPIAVVQEVDNRETDNEEFTDDESNSFDSLDNNLPKPVRKLVYLKENKSGKPTVLVQNLDEADITLGLAIESGENTENENLSDDNCLNIERQILCSTPDLPILEGGHITTHEDLRRYSLLNPITDPDPLTDTEDLLLDKKSVKNKLIKKNKRYSDVLLVTDEVEAAKTDIEDLYITDSELPKSSLNISVNIEYLTDIENLDVSEDEHVTRRPSSCTPDLMRQMGGEIIITQEGNGEINKNISFPMGDSKITLGNMIWSPMVTDTEEVFGSEEDFVLYSDTGTPVEIRKELNDMSFSRVSTFSTKKADTNSEIIYYKGGYIRECNTDIEEIDADSSSEKADWEASGKELQDESALQAQPVDAAKEDSDAVMAEEVTYESVLLTNFNRNVPLLPNPEKPIYRTTSYTEIDAMLDRMLTEVEQQEKIISLDEAPCINTLELVPSSDALIEVPIKKSIRVPKRYESTQEIILENSGYYELISFGDPNKPSSLKNDDSGYDLISFDNNNLCVIEKSISKLISEVENEESALLLESEEIPDKSLFLIKKASSESLSEVSDAYPDSWEDEDHHDYEPVEPISYKVFNNDIWWEGTYRNLSIVPEEDEENVSLIGTHSSLDADNKLDNARESENSSSEDEREYEKVVKAEVKLLVKTSEGGKDEIEIRSVSEFVEPENSISTFNTDSDTCLIDFNKTKTSKPVFTLQRLFIRTPKSNDTGSLPNHKELSKSRPELVSAPSNNFPLKFDSSCENLDLYANTPFYPCYSTYKSCPTTPISNTNPFIEFVTPPSQFTPPKAYCDWIPQTEADRGKPTPTTKTINEDNLDKINAASIDLEIRSKTNAFIDSERQTEPYEITETQTSPPAYKEDQKCEDKKQKKGFFGTLKTIVTKSFDYSDSDSEKSQKKSKKEKKKKSKDKKGKDTPETTIETSTKKPRLPTPPLERPEFENIPYAEASPTSEEPHFAIKEKANEIINEVEIAAISKINKASEHKIATKPPIPTKEKSFEVDLHKTIDQIGREILDEKTIVKHIPRLSKADISEDINAPILSEPPDHLIHYSQLDEYSQQLKITTHNLIQNEISFQGWSDDKYNIVKPIVRSSSQKTKRKHGKLFGFLGKKSSKEVEESDDDISKEIVEKHDEEPSKEKMQTEEDSRKSGFFNIFGKKNKKEDVDKIETSESKDNIERDFKTLQLSEKTITDMQNTQNFIHEEITRFEDIRPIITKVTTEDMEDKTEKSEKRKSGIFSGIFTKKDKIDAEDESGPILINQPESLKTSIIFQTDKVGIEKDTEKKVDSIIILQPQSKPDTANDQTEENIVFDEIKKQIVATTDFIKNEVDVYTDVKLIKIEEKIDHHKDDETNIMEDSTLAKDITEKGKLGIFGGLFTKKDKKDVTSDIEKHIKEPKDKGTSPILERKGKSKSPILDKKQISIPPKSINKEKVTNASKLSEAILKQMGETADFLKKEVEVYEDIKIIRSESLGITEQPIAEEEKTEKRKSGIFSGIFAKKDKKDVEDKFGTVSSKDSQTKSQSPKSVRKRTDTSEIALEIYDDVKPIETTKSVLDEIKMTKDEENATKSKVGILSGIFGKKDKKETEEQAENIAIKDQETKSEIHNLEGVNDIVVPKYKESETVIKQMNETADFIRREVDLYEDGKPKVATIVNAREAAEEKRDKPKVGIFSGIFSNKDKKDVEKEVAVVKESRIKSPSPILDKKETSEQIQFDDSKDILKQMIDTTDFLKTEVELYEDVKLVKPPIVTVEEYKDDKSEKRKSSIFGGIFTKKDKKVSEEEFDQPILKEAQSKPRTPIFSKKDKVITKPVLSDILIKQMTDTTEFLKMEVELYEDGEPPKPIQNFNLEDTIKEKESVSEEFTLTSPKKGIFKIFTKKDKKEESPAATRKEITEEPIQVVVDSGVEEIKLRKKQKNKPRSKSSKDSSESGEESDSSTKKIRFNIFSKKTKAEIKDPIKEAASIESKIGLPDEIVKSMNDTENFLYTEIKNYEDVKLLVSGRQSQDKEEYSETQSNDVKLKHKKNKKQKRDSSESGDESDSATKSKKFKLFGKTKEIPKATITEAPSKEEKLIISEETIKSMNLTTDFIKTELEKYEDGNTFAKSKIEQNITEKRDIQPAEEKKDIHQIEKKKDKKSRFKRDSSESGDESDSSAKKKFSLFGRKGSKRESMEKPIKEAPSKECQLGISELTIKDMEDTHNFLIKEVEYYHDVKPKLKPDDPQDSKVKSNIDQVDDSLKKFIENTNNFISTEIDHYHDVRPVNEDNEVNHVVDIYISDKKVSYDESQEKVKKEVTFMEEAVSKDILDTQSFLATEKEKYTDEDYKVDPILVTTIVFESPEDVIKQSKTVSPPEEHILELDINESSTKEVIEAKIKPEKKKKKGILGKIFSKSKDEGEIDLTDKVSDSIEKNVQEKIILIPKDIEYVDEKETTQSLPSTEELEDSKKKSKGLLGKITTKKGKIDAIKTESQPAKPKGGIFSKIGSKIVTKIDSTLDAVKDTAEPATKLSEEYKNESANEYVDVTTDRGIITESITIVGTKLPKADESKEGLEFTSTDDADSLIPKMVEIKEYLDQTDKDVKESVVQISIDTKDIIVHELKDAKKEESAEEKTKETINVFDLAAKGTKDEASEKVTVLKAESSIVDKIDRAKTIVTDKSIEVKEEILAKLGDIDKKSRDNKKIQETNSAIAMSIGDAICLKQAESINTKDYKDDKTTEEVRHSIDKSDLAAKIIDTKDAATTSKDNILVLKDRVLSNIQDSGETLENITEDYKESAEKMTTGLEKASMDSKDAVEVDIRNTKEAINLKLSDTKDVLDKKGYEVKENLDIIKDAIQTKTSDIADQVKETYADIDKATAYAIENVKNQKDLIGDELISSVNNTKDSLNDVRDGIKTKVVDATDCIESTIKDTRVVLDKGVEEIKEKAIESKEFVQKDFGKMTEEAASDIKSHTKEFKKKIDGKMDESKELLIKKTTDLKEKTKESKQSIGKGIMGFVKSTKDSLVHTKDSLKSKVDKKAKDGKEKLDKKTEHIKNKAKDNIESIQKGAIVAAKTAEGKLDAAKTVAIETVEDGKEKIKDTKHTIDEKREDLMDKAVDTKHKIEDNILGVIQSTKDSLIDSKDKFQSKIEDKKESIGTKIQDTQESIFEKAKDSAHVMDKTIDEKCADIKEKSKATKDNIEKVTKTTVETTLGTLENIKSTINAKTHDSKDVLEQKLLDSKQTIDKAYSGIEDEVKESKEKISKKLEAAQLETKDRIVDIQHAITSKIVDAKDVVSEKTDDTKCTLDKKAEKIKETLSDIKDSIEDKSKGVSFAIRDELVGVKTTISTKYGDFKDNVKGTKAELCQATIDIKDTSEYVIDEFAEGVKEAAISTKDTLIDIKDDVKTNVQKSTDIKIEEIKDAKNKIISDLGEGIQIKQNNLVNIKDAATGKAHEISEKAKGTKDNLKEQTKDTKEIIHGKFKDFKEQIEDTQESVTKEINLTKDSAIKKFEVTKDKAKDATDEIADKVIATSISVEESAVRAKEELGEKIEDLEDTIAHKGDSLKKISEDTKEIIGKQIDIANEKIKQTVKDSKDSFVSKIYDTNESIDNKANDAEKTLEKTATVIKNKALDTKAVIENEFLDKLTETKEDLHKKSQDTKDIIGKTATDITKTVKETKEGLEKDAKSATKSAGGIFSDIKQSLFGKADDAKEKAKETKKALDKKSKDAKEGIIDISENTKNEIKDSIAATKKKIVDVKDDLSEKAIEQKESFCEKVTDTVPMMDKDNEFNKIIINAQEELSAGISDASSTLSKTVDDHIYDITKKAEETKISFIETKDETTKHFKDDLIVNLADKTALDGEKDTIDIIKKQVDSMCVSITEVKDIPIESVKTEVRKDMLLNEDEIENQVRKETAVGSEILMEEIGHKLNDTKDIIQSKYDDIKEVSADTIGERESAIEINIKELEDVTNLSKKEMETGLSDAKASSNDIIGSTTDDKKVVQDKHETIEKDSTYTKDKAKATKASIDTLGSEINPKEDTHCIDDTKKSKGFLGKLSTKLGGKSKSEDKPEQSHKEKEKSKKSKGIFGKVGDKLSQAKDSLIDTKNEGIKSITEKSNETKEDALDIVETKFTNTKDILDSVTKTKESLRDSSEKEKGGINAKQERTMSDIKDPANIIGETTEKKSKMLQIKEIGNEIKDTKYDIKEAAVNLKDNICETYNTKKEEIKTILEKESGILEGEVSKMKDFIDQREINIDRNVEASVSKETVPIASNISEALDKTTDTCEVFDKNISTINEVLIKSESDTIEKKIDIVKSDSPDVLLDLTGIQLQDMKSGISSISEDIKSSMIKLPTFDSKQIETARYAIERENFELKDGSTEIPESIEEKTSKDSEVATKNTGNLNIGLDRIKCAEENIAKKTDDAGKQLQEKPEKSKGLIDDTCVILSDNKVSVDGDTKRKPLFRIESEEDSSEYVTTKRDSINSNILENFSKQKLEALVTDLDIFEDSSLVEPDLSLTERLETKLNDIEKIIESIEKTESELHDEKIEGKLKRVERKFERMASEVIDTEKDEAKASQLTTPEMEEKQDNEFRKVVSQLSREEVSEFQKEYASLWDEQTFSHTDDWDSTKTPDSQAEIIELPQGDIVYMGPVTLNKDNLVNKAGIEVDVIPRMRSPYASPKPKRKKRSKRAKSELGFHSKPKPSEEDRGSLPDLYTNKKGAIMNAILTMSPQRFLSKSTEGHSTISLNYFPKEEHMSQSLGSSESLSKGNIMDAVVHWLNRSSSIDYMNQSYTDTNISICDDDESLESCFLSDRNSFRADNIVPDIFISEDEAFLIYNEPTINKPTTDQLLEISNVPLTHTSAEITALPQPKPRSTKTSESQLELTSPLEQFTVDDTQISPVRDDAIDIENVKVGISPSESIIESYSERKKFWENVSSQSQDIPIKKRMSLQEESAKQIIPMKRTSIHEVPTQPPIPKPRTIQTAQSFSESIKEEAPFVPVTEYQSSFKDPSKISPKIDEVKHTLESADSIDSDNENSCQFNTSSGYENTGYISDSGDVEHYISDSEIEDRVPQIRERQMSVFQPPSSTRKSIYERSCSLPTEDLYEVSAQSILLRKQYFEEQIKKDMVEDELMTEIEEEPSPEHKTLGLPIEEEDEEPSGVKSVPDDITYEKTDIPQTIETIAAHDEKAEALILEPEYDMKTVSDLKKVFETEQLIKEKKGIVKDIVNFEEIVSEENTHIYKTHKTQEIQQSSTESDSILDRDSVFDDLVSQDETVAKPSDSIEVHVDKSEIEDSEKMTDLDATDVETKSTDSLNAPELSPKTLYNQEDIPEITISLSGKQRRISEDSEDSVEKPVEIKSPIPEATSPIYQPEEHIQDTIWEVSVESHPQTFEERVTDIQVEKQVCLDKDDDLSSSVRDESDLGSEIHQDHSESGGSDRRSESQADIEKLILESLHHQKISPEEARIIASELIADIEAEIHRRNSSDYEEPPAPEYAKNQVSDYLKQLAESKGLDSREVELVQSVLARKQRELSKLSRGDTQASSMEITDEDLRYSGADFSPTGSRANILEEQIDQLEAEKIHDEELGEEFARDIINEVRFKESSILKDYEVVDEDKTVHVKSELDSTTTENIKGEKTSKERKDVIMEEDETILDSVSEEAENIITKIDTTCKQKEVIETDEFKSSSISSAEVSDDIMHIAKVSSKLVSTITDDKVKEESTVERTEKDQEIIKGTYSSEEISRTILDDENIEKTISETRTITGTIDKDFEQKDEHVEETDISGDVETTITKQHTHTKESSSSTIVNVSHQETVTTSNKFFEDIDQADIADLIASGQLSLTSEMTQPEMSKIGEMSRTLSSESKSSLDGKSHDDVFSTCSSGRKEEKVEVILRKHRNLDDTSSSSSNLKPDRKSGLEFEAYSSSGESHYQSFEIDSTKSRPCSSDVEGLIAAGSSEYESALTSQDISAPSNNLTSTEYHTAVSSLSSKESMKSLDSESSGHLASFEVSEASETLVPSEFELGGEERNLDDDLSCDQPLLPTRQSTECSESEFIPEDLQQSIDISEEDFINDVNEILEPSTKMKRSQEMTFQPEPKSLVPDSPLLDGGQEVEEKLGTSLDDGSVLSMSLSSTSSAAAQRTVIELSHAESERLEGVTPDQLSIDDPENIGSRESLFQTPIPLTSEIATSTHQFMQEVQIDNVTLTTSVVDENGIQSVCTQVISQTHTPEMEKTLVDEFTSKAVDIPESKKRGHRRSESTSFIPVVISQTTSSQVEMERKLHSDLAESDKYTHELSYKEVESDEKKDVDEKEESYETEADQALEQYISDEVYAGEECSESIEGGKVVDDIILTATPKEYSPISESVRNTEIAEQCSEAQEDAATEAIEYSESITKQVAVDRITHKETIDKRDSHGKSSTTSSEKSSFEEAEAEAAFSMVPHVSPAHKAKQICPILEDEDAEKHELETRERVQKEFEERRQQIMKDQSPSAIPDIKVTQHMTPMDRKGFHYPDLELEEKEDEAQLSTPQTPASNSSRSSESTDQGGEYILDHQSDISIPEESDSQLLDEKTMESRSEGSSVVERTATSDKSVNYEVDKEMPSPTESPNSDSFEMLEKPDLIDEFVVIEEVAKEAHEADLEGKSVRISKGKLVKKHDTEVEELLVKSAPSPSTKMTDIKYYPEGSSSDELGFEFEDSPPNANQKNAGVSTKSPRDYVYEYDRELEANKKWIEQQFQGDQAAMIAAGYGYEMEFERCPLEDIKEEDDFDSRMGSLNSQKESGGSLGSVKDSYSSTPEYDVLAGRKYFTKSGEHDDISMNSLQEFENLERAMSLENRRFHQGSQDSITNGSFKTRYFGRSGQGDDVSVSSLKEFEGLEMACIAAHKVEVKVKEEEMLLAQIDEGPESLASETESCETVSGSEKKQVADSDEEDYEKRMFEIDEIIRQAQTNVERFIDLKEGDKTESIGRGDSIEEVSKVPDLDLDAPLQRTCRVQWGDDDVMQASTDSLDNKEKPSLHGSTDSLDQRTAMDIMTASTDSIEFQGHRSRGAIMTDSIEIKESHGMTSSDSLELATGNNLANFSDSIDEDGSRIGGHDQSSSSTGKDVSLNKEDDTIDNKVTDFMLESTDSIASTSTATHATYQYETDSVFSGSFTSGGSNTMVSSTDNIDPVTKESVDLAEAVRKVWFGDEYDDDESKPYVTEVIEPGETEVKRYTFKGPDAEQHLKQFIENFNEGEEVHEEQTVDEDGNVRIKRTIQKRIVIRDDGSSEDFREGIMKRTYIDEKGTKTIYTQQFEHSDDPNFDARSLLTSIAGDSAGEASVSWEQVSSETAKPTKAKSSHRRPLLLEISLDDQSMIEVDPREHDWRFNLPHHAEKDEASARTPEHSTHVFDQQQLSEETKELLKDMEKDKESKK